MAEPRVQPVIERCRDLLPVSRSTPTGHGLKDPERAITCAGKPVELEASLETVMKEVVR